MLKKIEKFFKTWKSVFRWQAWHKNDADVEFFEVPLKELLCKQQCSLNKHRDRWKWKSVVIHIFRVFDAREFFRVEKTNHKVL